MTYVPSYKQLSPRGRKYVFEAACARLRNDPIADKGYAVQALGYLGDPSAISLIQREAKGAPSGSDTAVAAKWAVNELKHNVK